MTSFLVHTDSNLGHRSPATQYDQAVDTAQGAALIQSGVTAEISRYQDRLSKRLQELLSQIGMSESVGVCAAALKVARDRSVTVPLPNGKRIIVSPSSVTVKVEF